MTHVGTASMYESGEYLAKNPAWGADGAVCKARWITDFLGAHDIFPRHIVEIGCGSGEVLMLLGDYYRTTKLEGWDISPQAHAMARARARNDATFHLGDWQPRRADLTMALDVFEHVPDYMGFLERIKAAGGLKLFHIPLDLSVQGLLRNRGLLHCRRQVGHLHYFCKDTALATLRDCGFEIIGHRYTHGAEQLPNRELRTRLFNIPRRLARMVNEDIAVRVMGGASMLVLTE